MPTRTPTEITVVHAPACHFCADADAALDELGRSFPIVVRRLPISGAEGQALVRASRAPMSPLVLVDGQVFSWGRLPRKKLQRRLEVASAVRVG